MKTILIGILITLSSVLTYLAVKTFNPDVYVCVQEIEYNNVVDRNVISVSDHGLWFSYKQDNKEFNSGLMKTQTDPSYGSVDISETANGTYLKSQRLNKNYYMHIDRVHNQTKTFSQCDKK